MSAEFFFIILAVMVVFLVVYLCCCIKWEQRNQTNWQVELTKSKLHDQIFMLKQTCNALADRIYDLELRHDEALKVMAAVRTTERSVKE